MGLEDGFTLNESVLLVLDVLITEYEKLMALGLPKNADTVYEQIEYCRTKKENK